MTRKIYIVVGEKGEYSDHTEWFVAAFLNDAQAIKYRDRCEAEVERMKLLAHNTTPEQRNQIKSRYDRNIDGWDVRYADEGAHYGVAEVDLLEDVPE